MKLTGSLNAFYSIKVPGIKVKGFSRKNLKLVSMPEYLYFPM